MLDIALRMGEMSEPDAMTNPTLAITVACATVMMLACHSR
jgi:hypothetical protein